MAKSIDLPSMEQQRITSHLSGGNAAYVEGLYEAYLRDRNEVPPEWRDYFDLDTFILWRRGLSYA